MLMVVVGKSSGGLMVISFGDYEELLIWLEHTTPVEETTSTATTMTNKVVGMRKW